MLSGPTIDFFYQFYDVSNEKIPGCLDFIVISYTTQLYGDYNYPL